MESTNTNHEDKSDSTQIKPTQESDRNDTKDEFICDRNDIDQRVALAWEVIVEEFSENEVEGGDA